MLTHACSCSCQCSEACLFACKPQLAAAAYLPIQRYSAPDAAVRWASLMVEKPVAVLQPPSEASHKSKHRHKEKKHKQRHRELGEASRRHRSGEREPQHVGVASGSIALAADYNSDPESGELSDTTRLAQKEAEREQQSRLRAETKEAASAASFPAPGALTEYGVCPSFDASSESAHHLLQYLLCSNISNLLQLPLQN